MQLRRPSDGAVSEPRTFEFLPLDAGRGFWASKRMKSNYNVFNNILSVEQGLRCNPGSGAMTQAKEETLRRKVRNPAASATVTAPAPPAPPPPLRNFANVPQPSSDLLVPRKGATMDLRPLSGMSTDTEATEVSGVTQLSVNEILSIAGGPSTVTIDGDDIASINLDTISVNSLLRDPAAVSSSEVAGAPTTSTTTAIILNNDRPVSKLSSEYSALRQPLGSMTSVLTVRENNSGNDAVAAVDVSTAVSVSCPSVTSNGNSAVATSELMDVEDIGAIYDDVMQCVYDDVDTKYDGIDFLSTSNEPPVPPARKRITVHDTIPPTIPITDPDKPLPGTPSKIKVLSDKIKETKMEYNTKREKEIEKKKVMEEKKRKEKEKKVEELEKKKMEKKKKLEDEKRAKAEEANRQSLFQRLFTRSKSQTIVLDQEGNEIPPVVADNHENVDGDAAAAAAAFRDGYSSSFFFQ